MTHYAAVRVIVINVFFSFPLSFFIAQEEERRENKTLDLLENLFYKRWILHMFQKVCLKYFILKITFLKLFYVWESIPCFIKLLWKSLFEKHLTYLIKFMFGNRFQKCYSENLVLKSYSFFFPMGKAEVTISV